MLAPALEGGRYTQKRTRDRRSPISLNALDDTAGFASPGELAAAYREWWRVLVSLRPLILNAFLIVLAVAVVEQQIPERLWDEIPLGNIMSVAETAIRALLLTPVAIAIHRLVILDEVTRAYTLPLGEPAFRVAWLFALGVIADLPFDLLTAMQARDASLAATGIGFLLALIAVVAFGLRLTVLLSAIAVAAPGARLKPALADTKGQALRILAIFVLALLPWIAAVRRLDRAPHRSGRLAAGRNFSVPERRGADHRAVDGGSGRIARVHRAQRKSPASACAAARGLAYDAERRLIRRRYRSIDWPIFPFWQR